MTKSRRKFTAELKAAIVRRHLKGKEPISAIAEELSIQPTQIHQWVAMGMGLPGSIQPTKVKVVGTFHVPSTQYAGKCPKAYGTTERAATFVGSVWV